MKSYTPILLQNEGEWQSFTTKDTQQRSPQAHASDLPLLQLLEQAERSPQTTLRVEAVPEKLAVAPNRFWIIHTESGLQIPGSFTESEVKAFFKATKDWPIYYWQIDKDTHKPTYSYLWLRVLEQICKQSKQAAEVAA